MGIFNAHSVDHPFSRGIQGAPGVGFRLTADGNYDITEKKLTNVGAPSDSKDAATKKYVDDKTSASGLRPPTTTSLVVNSNIDMKDEYLISNHLRTQRNQLQNSMLTHIFFIEMELIQ